MVQLLLVDGRADPSARHNISAKNASTYNNIEMMQSLLDDSRVSFSTYGNMMLEDAAMRGYLEMVRIILTNTRITTTSTFIGRVAYRGHHEVVVELLNASGIVVDDMLKMVMRNGQIYFERCGVLEM